MGVATMTGALTNTLLADQQLASPSLIVSCPILFSPCPVIQPPALPCCLMTSGAAGGENYQLSILML